MVGLYQLEVSPSSVSNTTVNATDSSTAPLLSGEENTDDLNKIFVFRSFLVAGGLIMTINAFIKLIHTRVAGRYLSKNLIMWHIEMREYSSFPSFYFILFNFQQQNGSPYSFAALA